MKNGSTHRPILHSSRLRGSPGIRQEGCRQSQQRQEGRQAIDPHDPVHVGQVPQPRRTDPADAEHQPEHQAETIPTRPGTASCAYTTSAAKPRTSPGRSRSPGSRSRPVPHKAGPARKGATPRKDTQITALRPIRSPTGPPAKVPAATAARKMNR
ncbi:hypothetical protein Ddc_20162 [Ditylenchus destructor]|nr:hypothetical protein Ddc_20162 [Ditylenchus destructor]